MDYWRNRGEKNEERLALTKHVLMGRSLRRNASRRQLRLVTVDGERCFGGPTPSGLQAGYARGRRTGGQSQSFTRKTMKRERCANTMFIALGAGRVSLTNTGEKKIYSSSSGKKSYNERRNQRKGGGGKDVSRQQSANSLLLTGRPRRGLTTGARR